MADLDFTDFFKEGSGSGVTNLDWLDVNEEDYRSLDRLPKQNLDIAPDLKALWSHEDKPSTAFVPNTGGPKTMADLSEVHGLVSAGRGEDLIKTARFAIMQSTDPARVHHTLTSRFDSEAIRGARTALASVFAERGLLGRFYIAASDFPDCNRGGKVSSEFVRRYASDAPFVIAKKACGDCRHRQMLSTGVSRCGVFHKQIEIEVPYSEALADQVEATQRAKGKAVQASTQTAAPRDRIRQAFLATTHSSSGTFTGQSQQAPKQLNVNAGEALIAASNLTRKRDEEAKSRIAAEKARPIVAFLRRELIKGRSEQETIHSLRLAFDLRDLQATRSQWEPTFRQAGLYGAVYTTQDSFEDCREGADFLNKHASKARAIVAGSKCGSCIFNKVGRCMMYGRVLVASAEDVLTPDTVRLVVDEHRIAGTLPQGSDRMDWGSDPASALKAVHRVASGPKPVHGGGVRAVVQQGFYGGVVAQKTTDLTKREIVKTAAKYMNEGLYGEDLLTVLKGRFDSRDLIATSGGLKDVLAEQGLQGIVYVDPAVYDDYGKGCKEASRLHRSRSAVQYLKVGSKCGSCVHQTRPGHCSVINKQLVVEPPYMDKAAEQRAILESGRATEVSYESLMNNGLSMMQEYQLQHQASEIDLAPERTVVTTEIEFGAHMVKLP